MRELKQLARDTRIKPGMRLSPATEIRPGQRHSVPTEIKPGERRSPATEFKPNQPARNKLPVGTETQRRDPNGLYRFWIKVAEPNKWRPRAVAIWERKNGPLPRGYVVHHKDRNSLNDDPDNLIALTRAEHTREHQGELHEAGLSAALARNAYLDIIGRDYPSYLLSAVG
jgi:hypothetical protein